MLSFGPPTERSITAKCTIAKAFASQEMQIIYHLYFYLEVLLKRIQMPQLEEIPGLGYIVRLEMVTASKEDD